MKKNNKIVKLSEMNDTEFNAYMNTIADIAIKLETAGMDMMSCLTLLKSMTANIEAIEYYDMAIKAVNRIVANSNDSLADLVECANRR